VIRCDYHECPGTVDASGYCNRCGRMPRPSPGRPHVHRGPSRDAEAVPVVDRPGAETGHRSPGDRWTVSGLVWLAVDDVAEPLSRVQADPQVPEQLRRCSNCDAEVGRRHARREALLHGFCGQCGHPFSFRPSLGRGDRVGRYEVQGCIAHGGLGWIYLAWHPDLHTYVALKGLIDERDAEAARMAINERNRLISLDHPNIVRILDFVTRTDSTSNEPSSYIVMEYVNGRSLREIWEAARTPEGEALPLEHVIEYGLGILAALGYLHGRGLLYCDMKPDNVIRTADRLKIIDLGGMRGIDDRQSPIVGTPRYQVDRHEIETRGVTVASDLYTVGRTLEVLFGACGDGPLEPDGDVDLRFAAQSFRRVVDRATHPQPERRFASAAAMYDQLRGVLREVISLRLGEERPEPSTVFAGTPALLDAGLGAVPALDRWTAGRRDAPGDGRPAPTAAAAALPVPRADPADPAADFLIGVGTQDPRRLVDTIAAYRQVSGGSVEIELCDCRALVALGDLDRARVCLERAVALLGAAAGHDWRIAWHAGLLALAAERVQDARDEFQRVLDALPGEDAPKLALGFCVEHLDEPQEARKYYGSVWRRDHSQVSAAFGLARAHLAEDDRSPAIQVLDAVPAIARHSDAARIAAVRVLSGRFANGLPSGADLRESARRVSRLYLDGGDDDGESRDRLIAAVREVALDVAVRSGAGSSAETDAILGDLEERSLRLLLEDSLRSKLASQARSVEDHDVLVDLANAVRPRTLW
jgi:serine/threonine-protein kinase PknG